MATPSEARIDHEAREAREERGEPPVPTPAAPPSESEPPAPASAAPSSAPGEPELRALDVPPLRAYSVGPAPLEGTRRLHLNEFRYAHAPGVTAALRGALAEATADELLVQYQSGPDPALLDALAQYVGAPSARHLLAAAGSDEVLRAVLDTCGLRGHRRLIMGAPAYTHFEHYARLRGLEIVAVPTGLGATPAGLEAAFRYYAPDLGAGCLVYLCSPNNPTGDLWPPAAVERLAADYPHSLFVVDEAYTEFAACHGVLPAGAPANLAAALNAASAVQVALRRPNVVVTRTLSKAFGLAALRVGYAVGAPETISAIGVAASPKSLSPLAARVAAAALASLGHYWGTTRAAKAEARRVVAALSAAGWYAADTPGNFYLVYAGGGRAAEVTAALSGAGVQARNRDELPGLAGFIRLTAGAPEDSEAVLAAFAALVPPPAPPPQILYAPKSLVAALKTLVRRLLGALAAAGVEVWAQGGTMLGMFRHRNAAFPGGMIPWDDDADLAYLIPESGADPLASLVGALRARGLTLQRNRTDAYWQVGTNAPGEPISSVHVDVFSYRAAPERAPDGQPVYVVDDARFRAEDPDSARADCNTSYRHDELFPLSHAYRFYDLVIPMPAAAGAVLRRALGDDFMSVARMRTAGGLVTFPLADPTPG